MTSTPRQFSVFFDCLILNGWENQDMAESSPYCRKQVLLQTKGTTALRAEPTIRG